MADFVRTAPVIGEAATMTRGERLACARDQLMEIFHRVWSYVLIGVGIGAAGILTIELIFNEVFYWFI